MSGSESKQELSGSESKHELNGSESKHGTWFGRLISRIARGSREFRDDRRGVVMIVFAASLPLLIAAGGGAVDVQRAMGVKARLQNAADSAVLASAVHDGTEAEKEAVAEAYLAANAGPDLTGVEVTAYSWDIETGVHALSAGGSLNTFFLGMVGFDTLDVAVASEATFEIPEIEMALVLDVSGSMAGTRIASLKTAATNLIDDLYDNPRLSSKLKISLVPFSSYVSLADAEVANMGEPPADATETSNRAAYGFCALERGGTKNGTRYHPSYAGGLFKGSHFTYHGTRFCDNEPKVVPLSDDRTALKTAVNALSARLATAPLDGLAWGARTLDPAWNDVWTGLDADPFSEDVVKAVLLMTDGEPSFMDPDQAPFVVDADGNQLGQAEYDATCTGVGAEYRVFGVAFEAGSTGETSLRNCVALAGGVYREATGGAELAQAFTDIANSLMNLRVSR